ncbi:MAG: hypothetical protein GSR81_02450 [Desulfurococcales archaeon]|nr:hypothetical protein [Desulfurococcales archaeon]
MRVRVSVKRSSRGSVSYLVTIPKHLHLALGGPEEYWWEEWGVGLLLIPVRRLETGEVSEGELEAIVKDLGGEARSARVDDPDELLIGSIIAHRGVETLVVDCRGGPDEARSLILYGDGSVRALEYPWLSCGYPGTSPGRLIRLISWLSGRGWAITGEVSEVELALKDPRAKAIVVEVAAERVRVRVYRQG